MNRRKSPCPWWRGHAWHVDGLIAPLTMQDTCARCGLRRVFNGALEETTYYKPLAEVGLTENTEKETSR